MKKQVLLAAFILCFLALHIYLKRSTQPAASAAGPKSGGMAVAFEGTTVDGKIFKLADVVKSHPVTVVNFWESWCGPCKSEMPALEALYRGHADKGLMLVGVYGNSTDESVKEIIRILSITFPVMRDRNSTANASYAVSAVPTTFVIDSNLKILKRFVGADPALVDFVEETLREKEKERT